MSGRSRPARAAAELRVGLGGDPERVRLELDELHQAVVGRHARADEVAVVEVFPSPMPPVRYKGRVHVRVGPRRAVASIDEERRLTERRVELGTHELIAKARCMREQMRERDRGGGRSKGRLAIITKAGEHPQICQFR